MERAGIDNGRETRSGPRLGRGETKRATFGADYTKGRMITGVSLSHSRSFGDYAGVNSGRVRSAVTRLYPWIGYKPSERVTV